MSDEVGEIAATRVTIALFAAARAAAGCDAVLVAPGPLVDLLDEVGQRYPGFRDVRSRCTFLVDGLVVHDERLVVPSGARVDVLPPFAGG